MGALHEGHISLIEQSVSGNDFTVVSIFVNPTQFNNKADLEKYPKKEKEDIEKIKNAGAGIIFMPDENEMYPDSKRMSFDFEGIDKVMEGKFREGHFNGVGEIVFKLFDAVKPDRAYFGKKDFQQLAIIKLLVKKYMSDYSIEIVPCEIVREPDGLAMSSRNMRLSAEERKAAIAISKVLFEYSKEHKNININNYKEKDISEINKNPFLETEYFEIADNNTLMPVKNIEKGNTTACIAVYAGKVRLIDNISF